MIVAELLTVSKLQDNYDVDATAGGLWTATTTYQATVPAGKRWKLLGGSVYRSVNATVIVEIRNAANQAIVRLDSLSASTGTSSYPGASYIGPVCSGLMMDPGWYILMTFGVAQDASAWASAVVLEVDV